MFMQYMVGTEFFNTLLSGWSSFLWAKFETLDTQISVSVGLMNENVDRNALDQRIPPPNCTMHLDIIKIFYLPTDAFYICLRKTLKFTLKLIFKFLLHVSVYDHHHGAYTWA